METVIRILPLILTLLLLCGCGLSDWTYELNGGYEIWRVNSHNIELVYRDREQNYTKVVIDNLFVTDFSLNERFIGVKGIPYAGMHSASDEELESNVRVFYLVDVTRGELYGRFDSKKEYDAKCLELSTGEMLPWRTTKGLGVEADKQKRDGDR